MTDPALDDRTVVVLLTGPSGSGKSRLARRSGLPVLNLDDFYRAGSEPGLPLLPGGQIDWDDPRSWDHDGALRAVLDLCSTGSATVPVYDIAANGAVGVARLSLDGASAVVAEGIFASELVSRCRSLGVRTEAICVRRPRWLTFVLRLTRDLREHRKSPMFLVRRGFHLARRERDVVDDAVAAGCRACSVRQTRVLLGSLH